MPRLYQKNKYNIFFEYLEPKLEKVSFLLNIEIQIIKWKLRHGRGEKAKMMKIMN